MPSLQRTIFTACYAADISKKVRAQQNQAMRDGEFVGVRPPYGYWKDPDNCHRLLVNEDTAPIVRQIFQWTVDGIPLNMIVKRLNESGVMTPGYYHASCGLFSYDNKLAGSGKWQSWTVGKILADQVYTGDMVHGKHTNVGHKQVVTKPVDWIVVRNTHEPLVSREVFAKAQAVREQMASKYTRTMKVPYSENILRGRVFCAHCGKNLHRQRSYGRYFYRCISNDRMGEGSCTGGIIHLPEPDLFDAILTIIRQKAQVDQEIAELGRQTQKNKALHSGLYENFVKGTLTRAEYLEMREDYSQKISGAAERVQQLQTRQSELERQMERCTSMADKLAAVDKDTALSALLVEQLIERVTVNGPDDVSVKFSFEGGFERVLEVLEFIDNGYSGTNFERPAVQELLDQMREGKINCIIVKDFTRFGRNSIEVGYFMDLGFTFALLFSLQSAVTSDQLG